MPRDISPKLNPFAQLLQLGIRVDLFAGGGGASTGIEMGSGLPVDLAINHDPDAIELHKINHPHATHLIEDVYAVDPVVAVRGRKVAHLHASPDCRHFSQACAGQPRKEVIRSLSWVVIKWAGLVAPDLITMENVEQILDWSPLVAKRCKKTGRVVTLEKVMINNKQTNRVASPGEVVSVDNQFLIPNKKKKGHNWACFVQSLRHLGYQVEYRMLAASSFGAPTTRERLFLIARRDGLPIVWPENTHNTPVVSAVPVADVIDFSNTGRSIFNRPRPLVNATLKRIAKGVQKFVIDAKEPFFLQAAGTATSGFITEHANASSQRTMPLLQPLRTICASVKGGHFSLVSASLVQLRNNCDTGSVLEPLSTITAGGLQHALMTAFITRQFGRSIGHPVTQPSAAITAGGGGKSALVQLGLAGPTDPDVLARAVRCSEFMRNYLEQPACMIDAANDDGPDLSNVTIYIDGEPWLIVDIHLRMLTPRELFLAQGFPRDYIIDRGADGRRYSISKQVRFVGNSVSPMPMAALVYANYLPWLDRLKAA